MFGGRKKGAEETNALIWVVLALLVVGVFALVYFKIWGKTSSLIELTPEDKTLAIQVCKLSASLDNSVYCGDFKKLDTGYYSCGYLAEQLPPADVEEWAKSETCEDQYAEQKCKDLATEAGFKEAVINGMVCQKEGNLFSPLSSGETSKQA